MSKGIILQDTSPEQMVGEIVQGVKEEIASLKKSFQPKEPEDFLTRKETKELLKIDLSTLWAWTKKGKLKSYGIGNRIYYKRSEIEQNITPINF